MFDSLGVSPWFLGQVDEMELSTWETFLLIRLVRNLKGSQVDFIKRSIKRFNFTFLLSAFFFSGDQII